MVYFDLVLVLMLVLVLVLEPSMLRCEVYKNVSVRVCSFRAYAVE
jgi:hypothetical protein